MNKLKSSSQREKVKRFMSFTHAPERVAITCLQLNDWRLEAASDHFFRHPERYQTSSRHRQPAHAGAAVGVGGGGGLMQPHVHHVQHAHQTHVDPRRVEQFYLRYCDRQEPGRMGVEGVARLLDDLQLAADSRLVLVLAWRLRAQTQCEFTRQEFMRGMHEMGCDSVDRLRAALPTLETELRDPHQFKDFYMFAFQYAKNPGQKGLDLEVAIAYWKIVITGLFQYAELWYQFLREHHRRDISRDTWTLLLEFVLTVDAQFSNYDEEGAWPVLIDEFVEYARPLVQQQPPPAHAHSGGGGGGGGTVS